MTTLNKLNIFLIDESKPSKKIKILENIFKYPQPLTKTEAQLYFKNMFRKWF